MLLVTAKFTYLTDLLFHHHLISSESVSECLCECFIKMPPTYFILPFLQILSMFGISVTPSLLQLPRIKKNRLLFPRYIFFATVFQYFE